VLCGIKIDVDTFRGMREGLPRMLDLLRQRRIEASVFVSMGPDHSGRAIRRLFTRPGFLGKMLRTRAVSLYGPRTILYGTLLPGPRIAEKNSGLLRRIDDEGHEAGVHGWDHVRWQDGLGGFDERTIARELAKAFEVFERVTGRPPRAVAAPGWIANERSLAVQEGLNLRYASDVRGEFPFIPRAGNRTFGTLQIPTTLPTLDELIGRHEEGAINELLVEECRRQALARPASPIVHTVHTEVEGLSRLASFSDLLDRLLAEGAIFEPLDRIAARLVGGSAGDSSQDRSATAGPTTVGTATPGRACDPRIPVCEVREGCVPGRSGTLAVQVTA
jgi:peptidoglycan/xylan/chitin deacetylase (PgdA/CDA1 family)